MLTRQPCVLCILPTDPPLLRNRQETIPAEADYRSTPACMGFSLKNSSRMSGFPGAWPDEAMSPSPPHARAGYASDGGPRSSTSPCAGATRAREGSEREGMRAPGESQRSVTRWSTRSRRRKSGEGALDQNLALGGLTEMGSSTPPLPLRARSREGYWGEEPRGSGSR